MKGLRIVATFQLSALLAAGLIAAAAPGPSASPSAGRKSQQACIFENRYSMFAGPCAPFTSVGIRVKAAILSSAFGTDAPPQDIGVLDDGSVIVQTEGYGLYGIAGGRLRALWRPVLRCERQPPFEFAFTGSFDDEMLMTVHYDTSAAVRPDGSLAFRLPLAFDSVTQGAGGVIWLLKGRYPDETLYAYFPRTQTQVTLQFPKGGSIFRSPNGHVYASNSDGLFDLESQPTARARLVHRPIRSDDIKPYHRLDFFVSPIQAVGRDGSLWASTPTQVIHVHPDGTLRVMRFTEPPNSMSMPWPAIRLTMTRDGAVWATWGKIIRIDNSDRIQVLTLPPPNQRSDVRFGPDSSLWLLARDARAAQPLGVVNFVPAPLGRNATAWPFKPLAVTASATPFVSCPRPTTPPTPAPPLPPKSGALDFVYSASETSNGVWGYWADRHGKLTPVRGAPFLAGNGPVNVTIDPAGRHLYVGTGYDGIFVYAIDTRSGTLLEIDGSPFDAASGPTTVAIDRSGRYAFAANINAKKVTGYAINAQSGALHPLAWSPLAMNRHPFRLAINPQRDVAYFITDGDVETFDASGGALRNLSTVVPAGGGDSLLIDPHGQWAYLASDFGGTIAVYGIDRHTGVLTSPSPAIKAGNEPRAMVTDPAGRFLYITKIPSRASKATVLGFRINARNGALRALPTSPYTSAPGGNGMTITPDGAFLYATNFSSKSISGFAIDRKTGALWPLPSSPFKTGDTLQGIVSCRRVGDTCKTTVF